MITRYVLLVPVKSVKAKKVIRPPLQRVYPQCGVPEVLVVDQQRFLVVKELQKYAEAHGMDILPIPPNAKDKNAMPERAIRTLRDLLAKMFKGKKWETWEKYFSLVQRLMRETPDQKSKVSPYELVYESLRLTILPALPGLSWI